MPNGKPTREQADVIAGLVAGKVVHDLGAGDCVLSMLLLELGAASVIAVDDHLRGYAARLSVPDLHFVSASFEEYVSYKSAASIELAFVSWPANYYTHGLVTLLERSARVIYLGSNTDCNACGGSDFWDHCVSRELLRAVPDRANTLLVLGAPTMSSRALTGEERAAVDNWRGGDVVRFEDALARTVGGK